MTFRYRIDKKNLLMMSSNSSVNFLQCIISFLNCEPKLVLAFI